MRWEVKGALRESGDDVIIFIEADNKASAERRANRRGIIVESLNPVFEKTTSDTGEFESPAITDVPAMVVYEPPLEEVDSPLDDLAIAAGTQALSYQRPNLRPPPLIHQHLPTVPVHHRGVVTIEKTSKFWKGQMLISTLLCIVGVVLACAGINMSNNRNSGPSPMAVPGFLLLFVGFVWFVVARIGAWWNHG